MDRLEAVLRAAESPQDLVLLLRGGEDTSAKILRQAPLLAQRYSYAGVPARGISVFAAHGPDEELTVLDSKLRPYPKYRRLGAPRLAEFAILLPTFQPPHWTILLRANGPSGRSEQEVLADLLDTLGPVLDNPRYVPDRARRG